ncbi:MAG: hypothetical protein JWP81_1818 [Ferruginibacter sp.]|nr:hypothetical protein [Ferruginibacter sp.]
MEQEKRYELLIKIITALVTLATVIIGVWQFNNGQRQVKEREIQQRKFEIDKMNNQASIETLTKFKEIQNKLYTEAASVISYLSIHADYTSPKYKENIDRFWQLYWVELSSVESTEVESAMIKFGGILEALETNKFSDIADQQPELKIAGYEVAQAIKKSARTWELPEGLKNK